MSPTPASTPVTVSAKTSTKSKLQTILDAIAAIAAAELPIILQIEHNPTTQAETAAGIVGIQTAAAVLDANQQ